MHEPLHPTLTSSSDMSIDNCETLTIGLKYYEVKGATNICSLYDWPVLKYLHFYLLTTMFSFNLFFFFLNLNLKFNVCNVCLDSYREHVENIVYKKNRNCSRSNVFENRLPGKITNPLNDPKMILNTAR